MVVRLKKKCIIDVCVGHTGRMPKAQCIKEIRSEEGKKLEVGSRKAFILLSQVECGEGNQPCWRPADGELLIYLTPDAVHLQSYFLLEY